MGEPSSRGLRGPFWALELRGRAQQVVSGAGGYPVLLWHATVYLARLNAVMVSQDLIQQIARICRLNQRPCKRFESCYRLTHIGSGTLLTELEELGTPGP